MLVLGGGEAVRVYRLSKAKQEVMDEREEWRSVNKEKGKIDGETGCEEKPENEQWGGDGETDTVISAPADASAPRLAPQIFQGAAS